MQGSSNKDNLQHYGNYRTSDQKKSSREQAESRNTRKMESYDQKHQILSFQNPSASPHSIMNNTVLSLSEHSHSQILNQIIPNTADSALGVSQASVVLGNDYIMPNRGSAELENEYLVPANGERRMSQHSSSLADDL